MQFKQVPSAGKLYPVIFLALFWGILLSQLYSVWDQHTFSLATLENFQNAQWISAVTEFRIRLGDRVFPEAIIGKAGWLFYSGDHNIDTYQNATPGSGPSVIQVADKLIKLNKYLQKRGIALLVLIPPGKETIYPQYVPDQIQRVGKELSLDQLVRLLGDKNAGDMFLDLRPALKQASAAELVYYRTDTHWNDIGAYIAYREILLRLQQRFPGLQPFPLERFKVQSVGIQNKDIAGIIGSTSFGENVSVLKPDFLLQTRYTEITLSDRQHSAYFASNPDQSLPRMFAYHDSFLATLKPLIGEHFSHALYVAHNANDDFFSWLDYERPDVVIFEFAERDLYQIPGYIKDIPAP